MTGQWFSPHTPVFSTNKTERHDIAKKIESGAKLHNLNPSDSVINQDKSNKNIYHTERPALKSNRKIMKAEVKSIHITRI